MPGTYEGGKASMATNKAKYGEDFPRRIGRKGGQWKGKKGFAVNDLAPIAGAIGGSTSRRYKDPMKPKPSKKTKAQIRAAVLKRLNIVDDRDYEKEQNQMEIERMKGIGSKYQVRRPW